MGGGGGGSPQGTHERVSPLTVNNRTYECFLLSHHHNSFQLALTRWPYLNLYGGVVERQLCFVVLHVEPRLVNPQEWSVKR